MPNPRAAVARRATPCTMRIMPSTAVAPSEKKGRVDGPAHSSAEGAGSPAALTVPTAQRRRTAAPLRTSLGIRIALLVFCGFPKAAGAGGPGSPPCGAGRPKTARGPAHEGYFFFHSRTRQKLSPLPRRSTISQGMPCWEARLRSSSMAISQYRSCFSGERPMSFHSSSSGQ